MKKEAGETEAERRLPAMDPGLRWLALRMEAGADSQRMQVALKKLEKVSRNRFPLRIPS